MRNRTRVICFIPLILLISFGVWNYYYGWRPPEFSPDLFHTVGADVITIKKPGTYEIFHNLIINGKIIYMDFIDGKVQLYLQGIIPLRVNCCFPQALEYRIGDDIYLKGWSYFYFNTSLSLNSNILDGYFLAIEGHKLISYKFPISLIGLTLVLLILFTLFKMKRDLSFLRRGGEFIS
ncbi:MAG: hypothetical protein ACFFDN_40040 [Candidatus Hodarchaeota archaeon]